MTLLSRGLRSALSSSVRARSFVPTQAARFESTDAASSSSSTSAPASADKSAEKSAEPAASTKTKNDVPFADRALERKMTTAERKKEQKKAERIVPKQQRPWNPAFFNPKGNDAFLLENMPKFEWDEPSAVGFLRIQQLEEMRSLMSKAEIDREALQAQAKKFQPPKGQIRVTRTVDLSDPDSPLQQKAVVIAPVSSLPLEGSDALQRLKVLAGPRWTPGWPGRHEGETPSSELGKDGFVKISEETYATMRMNRKSASDMLERLVQAANDKNSPLPADTPQDPRYMLMRARKRKGGARNQGARLEALKRNPIPVGGVRGFPLEWLTPEQREKLEQKQKQ